jgi:hypothetical protein
MFDDQESIEVTQDAMTRQLGHLELLLQKYGEPQRVNPYAVFLRKKPRIFETIFLT